MHVIVPALNEEDAVGDVVRALHARGFERVLVVDNGSTDRTAVRARQAGARVIAEPRMGYGAACLAGIGELQSAHADDVVAFMDADGSDDAGDLLRVITPILRGEADMVIGSRTRGAREPGALPLHARFGNALASWLIRLRTGQRYSDLGPMRAVGHATLMALGMRDTDYGWTVEMQLKAAQRRLRILEVPVSYRRRIGKSKISGTVRGSVRAGAKIITTILAHGR